MSDCPAPRGPSYSYLHMPCSQINCYINHHACLFYHGKVLLGLVIFFWTWRRMQIPFGIKFSAKVISCPLICKIIIIFSVRTVNYKKNRAVLDTFLINQPQPWTKCDHGNCCPTLCSNKDPISDCCFCYPTLARGHAGCLPPRENAIGRHGRAHKMFFDRARAQKYRLLNDNWTVHIWFTNRGYFWTVNRCPLQSKQEFFILCQTFDMWATDAVKDFVLVIPRSDCRWH